MGQVKERRIRPQLGKRKLDKQIHKRKKMARMSTENAIRKSSQATSVLSTDRKTWSRKTKKEMA
jgi:hypothetical protein